MKSVAFLRNTWRRKDKDKKSTPQGKMDAKQKIMVPESAPCTPTTTTFEIPTTTISPPLPDHRVRSVSQDTLLLLAPTVARKAGSPLASSSSSLIDAESIASSSTAFSDRYDSGFPSSPVVWKFSHGPPKNAFHGPPQLNLYSPVLGTSSKSTGGMPPTRPPRPPPLNLYPATTKRPVNTGLPPRPAGRVTFALPPNPRAINPAPGSGKSASGNDSPRVLEDFNETASQSSQETTRCACSLIFSDGNHVQPHYSALSGAHAANQPLPRRNDSLPSSPRTAHAILDLSDSPVPQRVYQSSLHTSSTPHLPSRGDHQVPPVPPLPPDCSSRETDDTSNFPLSLFPEPPPLFIRRKVPKNFMLRPSTATTPLPPSPGLTSPDHTPLVTPSTPRPHTAPGNSKSYPSFSRYPSPRAIPPPLFDPPTSPLPTPPTSPSMAEGLPHSPLSKTLRAIKSSNQLRPELFIPPALPTHRATSSEPPSLPDRTAGVNQTRRRVQSRPEGRRNAIFKDREVTSEGRPQWNHVF